MAKAYIQVPVDGVGKKVDTIQYTRGADTIQREVDAVDPAIDPQSDVLSSSSLAAGTSVDMDGAAIASGKIGKLLSAVFASSVACKWVLKTRDGAVTTNVATVFTSGVTGGQASFMLVPPSRETEQIAYGDGNENWRVTVTNLGHAAADVYAVVYWDHEPN